MIQNLEYGEAVQGFDAVAFFDGKAKKGLHGISSTYNEAKYHFSSHINKDKFDQSPDKYTPQYGGFCSIAMSEGAQAQPNPKSFLIQDGKLYLFTMMFFGIIDAKRQWVKDPKGKQTLADAEWSKMNSLKI
tara:strand:- start:90 stop:482 length:393 start_codon:yes stop_codon:yes gene_type:complete